MYRLRLVIFCAVWVGLSFSPVLSSFHFFPVLHLQVQLSNLRISLPISEQFHHGLMLMNRAVSGGYAPDGAREEVAYLSANEQIRLRERAAAAVAQDVRCPVFAQGGGGIFESTDVE